MPIDRLDFTAISTAIRCNCNLLLSFLPKEPIMPTFLSPSIMPILLLIVSNVFMTFAWYGHLKYPAAPLTPVVFVSWGIALVEYWFAIPANRIGQRFIRQRS